MPNPRILVILNPVSGHREYDPIKARIEARLLETGIPFTLCETEGEGDAMRWARDAEGYDLVIVGGGDGTVMEAMTGLIENPNSIPLAQLAMGTANLLVRALAIPIPIDKGLDLALESGVSTLLDVGYLTDHERYFALVAGSGWDARLIRDADRKLKKRFGFLAYVWTGIKSLFFLKNSEVTLVVDGERHEMRAHTVEVINVGEIYGTGISLGENMSPHDGRLNVAVTSARTLIGLVGLFFRLLFRRYDRSDNLRYYSASTIEVDADPPLPLQADGETIGSTPFRIEVKPDEIRLVVPRHYAEKKKLGYEPLPLLPPS